MLIPNRFTSTEKPTNQSHLEIEPLDVRTAPAILNGADVLVDAAMAADAVTAGGVENAAVAQVQAPPSLAAQRTAPIDAVAATFPAADAALAAARPAAPDALRAIVPLAIASALQAGRLDLSPEMRAPGMAAPDNNAAAVQMLFAASVPQTALPDTTSTIPTALESSGPTTAAPPALDLPETRSPLPADPFQALGTAPGPLAAPLPESEFEPFLGVASERQAAVAEARPANILVTWQPPAVVADAVPNTAGLAALPETPNLALLDEESTASSAWPLAPAIAALYEVWYRGNRI